MSRLLRDREVALILLGRYQLLSLWNGVSWVVSREGIVILCAFAFSGVLGCREKFLAGLRFNSGFLYEDVEALPEVPEIKV